MKMYEIQLCDKGTWVTTNKAVMTKALAETICKQYSADKDGPNYDSRILNLDGKIIFSLKAK